MKGHPRRRSHASRRRPLFYESLEVRQVLSDGLGPSAGNVLDPGSSGPTDSGQAVTGPLQVESTRPLDGSVVTTLPRSFSVWFNQPIDPASLTGQDLVLETTDSRGNLVQIFPATESLDPTRQCLTATIAPGTVFAPGSYRIRLSDWALLQDDAGDVFLPSDPSQPLGSFDLEPVGPSCANAVDLNQVSSAQRFIPGALDLAAFPGQVQLYRFELGSQTADRLWRLGTEVRAARDGSSLSAELALFDAQGNLIAVAQYGMADAPNDPFLFATLPAGTYYLGVSGVGNVPGTPTGYNLAAGQASLVLDNQPGGPFRLDFVADPLPAPARCTGLQLESADPADPASPTGFWLQFSDVVELGATGGSGPIAEGNVQLRDANGTPWNAVVTGFNGTHTALRVELSQRLPMGTYTVRLGPDASLTDLVGRPIEPRAGDLGKFDVAQPRAAHAATDLGALYPSLLRDPDARELALQPGESLTYRMVSLGTVYASLVVQAQGGAFGIELVDGQTGVTTRIPLSDLQGCLHGSVQIPEGEEILRFTATGDRPAVLSWKLTGQSDNEDVGLNGVGQGPALGLRITPGSGNGTGTKTGAGTSPGSGSCPGDSVSPWSPQPSPIGPAVPVPSGSGHAIAEHPAVEAAAGVAAPTSSGLLSNGALVLSPGGQLVGRPAAIGQAANGGPYLADSGTSGAAQRDQVGLSGALAGAMYERPVLSPTQWGDAGDGEDSAKPSERPAEQLAGLDGILPRIEVGRSSPDRWVSSLVDWMASLSGGTPSSAPSNSGGAADETLAGIDPLALLGRPRRNSGAATPNGSEWLADPRALLVGSAITLLAAVEGRRWVLRWRNQRAVLRRLRGLSGPIEHPIWGRGRRVPVGPPGAGL